MTNKDLQLYERIYQYLEGELQGIELAAFKERLEKDTIFASEVALHKNLTKIVEPEDEQVKNLRNTLKKVNRQSSAQPQKAKSAKVISFPRIIVSVAAVLLLGVVSYFVFNTIPQPPPVTAYNYEIKELSFSSKGAATAEEQLISLEQKFNNKQYSKALSIANQYLLGDAQNYEVLYAKGIAHLELSHYQEAIQTFQTLDNLDRREVNDQAKWYLAMTYLKMKNIEKTKQTLQQLIETKAYNSIKAKELIIQL